MIKELSYYIYAYLRKDGTPYYIGKGKGRRAFQSHSSGANNITPKDKSRVVIMETNLTNLGALALERFYIRWYGRKDLGTGILRNRTDGGDGASNVSQESKEINVSSRKRWYDIHGHGPTKGKKFSEKAKENIRFGALNRKYDPEKLEKTRQLLSIKNGGIHNPMYGKPHPTRDSKWWNNGCICKRNKEKPGENWILGRLKRNASYSIN